MPLYNQFSVKKIVEAKVSMAFSEDRDDQLIGLILVPKVLTRDV